MHYWEINQICRLQAFKWIGVYVGWADRTYGYLFLVPLFVYFSASRDLGVRFTWVLAISEVTIHLEKLVFHSPRPSWISDHVVSAMVDANYGWPSGHAQSAAVLCFFAIRYCRSYVVKSGFVIFLLAMSIGRVFLGAHFPTDVIGGWLVAAVMVALMERLSEGVVTFLPTMAAQLMFLCVICTTFVAVALLLVKFAPIDDVGWSQFSSHARDLGGLRGSVLQLLSTGVSLVVAHRFATFVVPADPFKRCMLFLGAVLLIWSFSGLQDYVSMCLPGRSTSLSIGLTYAKQMGVFVIYPCVLLRVRFLTREANVVKNDKTAAISSCETRKRN